MMKNLWAPWRKAYVQGVKKESGCLFCRVAKENKDDTNLVLARKERCFLMLNLYPYNNGHLMIAPYMHVSSLEALPKEDRDELFAAVTAACTNIRKEMNPEGFNIGMNIGGIAGAGVADHIHVHIVPRWGGDTNFMPVVGEVKVISETLQDSYNRLKKYTY
jgi:ATP adenylyltransferase